MKTLCYSIRLKSVVSISEKALKVRAYDGSEDVLPKSCLFGQDFEVQKSDAYWIAAWILPKKKLQYSAKKKRWFDENRKMLPTYEVSRHKPAKVETKDDNIIEELAR